MSGPLSPQLLTPSTASQGRRHSINEGNAYIMFKKFLQVSSSLYFCLNIIVVVTILLFPSWRHVVCSQLMFAINNILCQVLILTRITIFSPHNFYIRQEPLPFVTTLLGSSAWTLLVLHYLPCWRGIQVWVLKVQIQEPDSLGSNLTLNLYYLCDLEQDT